ITQAALRLAADVPSRVAQDARAAIEALRDEYAFFHWHVEFPQVFRVPQNEDPENDQTGWSGGFDCVLGNPPWDQIEAKTVEVGDERRHDAPRLLAGIQHFVHTSGRFPTSSYGRLNLAPLFVETALSGV